MEIKVQREPREIEPQIKKLLWNLKFPGLNKEFSEKMKLISSILLLNAVNCMYFYLEPGTKKCIKECFTKSL